MNFKTITSPLIFCVTIGFTGCVDQPLQTQTLTNHAIDSIIVRHILDLNGFTTTPVKDVSGPDTGRIESLIIQYETFDTLPPEIIKLTKLSFLHLTHGNLKSFPDTIGYLSSLTYLNISRNKITRLPGSIVRLQLPDLGITSPEYTGLFVEFNNICSVSVDIQTWLNVYEPEWQKTQMCQ